MTSCSKEELLPTEHRAHINISTHHQTQMIAYAVNIATIPGISNINSDYDFYAMLGCSIICCNVHTPDFHSNVSVVLTGVGYMD